MKVNKSRLIRNLINEMVQMHWFCRATFVAVCTGLSKKEKEFIREMPEEEYQALYAEVMGRANEIRKKFQNRKAA